MRRSSKIVLAICGVLLASILYLYFRPTPAPDMAEQDAHAFLTRLGSAFENKSVSGVTDFAAPDAKVAGRQLSDMRRLLQFAYQYIHNPHIEFQNVKYARVGDTVTLNANVKVTDEGNSVAPTISQPVTLVLKSIITKRMFGLLTSYEWKVTQVDTSLPTDVDF